MIFLIPLEESDPYSMIEYVNQSLMRASNGIKGLNGFTFRVKAPEVLQQEGFESVLHPIPGSICCCILHQADLDCVDEGHLKLSQKIAFR